MALFETKDIDALMQQDDGDNCAADHSQERMIIAKKPNRLYEIMDCVLPDRSIHFISDGDWSMHDLLVLLLKDYPRSLLYISTYAIREYAIRIMIDALAKKELLSVNMLLDYRAKVLAPEVVQLASNTINQIRLAAVHAKVMVLQNDAGCFTCVGSANWTNNPRIEAGVITLDKSVANFHIQWIQKALDNADVFE